MSCTLTINCLFVGTMRWEKERKGLLWLFEMIEICKDLSDGRLNGTENHWSDPSLLRQSSSIPCLLWLLHFRKMPFKRFDRSQRDFELFRQALEFVFLPFNLTLVQKIAHCLLERIFGGWFFFCWRKILMRLNALTTLSCAIRVCYVGTVEIMFIANFSSLFILSVFVVCILFRLFFFFVFSLSVLFLYVCLFDNPMDLICIRCNRGPIFW